MDDTLDKEKTSTPISVELDALESQSETDTTSSSTSTRNPVIWTLMVLAIISSDFVFALENTITANLIPVIVNHFGETINIPWLSMAFDLGAICAALPLGQLYSMFDAKLVYIMSITLFAVGTTLCGSAPNLDVFIVGRAITGVGGAGTYTGIITLLSAITSPTERPVYLGLIGVIFGVGSVLGPVIGSVFAESHATWRWGFYIHTCIFGLLSPIYFFLVPSCKPRPGRKVLDRLRDFDFLGTVLSVGMMVCLIMAINFGGTLYRWDSVQIIFCFTLAGLLTTAFVLQQAFGILIKKTSRLFPVAMLKDKEALSLFCLTFVMNAADFVPIYYIPLYFQLTRGDGPMESAVRLLPLIIFISVTVMFAGWGLSKGGYYMPWFLAGSILELVAGVLFSRIHLNTSAAYVYGAEILFGIGSGCGIQTGYAVVQAISKPDLVNASITFLMIGQLLSMVLALSICGSMFVNTALRGLQSVLSNTSSVELEAVLLGTAGDFLQDLPAGQKQQALDVIVSSLRMVFSVIYIFAAVGVVAALFLRRTKMSDARPQ